MWHRNRATQLFAKRFFNEHVSVNSVCPGWIATHDMDAPRTVEQGVASIMAVAKPEGSGLGLSTGTFTRDGEPLEW